MAYNDNIRILILTTEKSSFLKVQIALFYNNTYAKIHSDEYYGEVGIFGLNQVQNNNQQVV